MEDQGGAGGAPLHGDTEGEERRKPHAVPPRAHRGTRAADTDEASRLDRPEDTDRPGEDGPAGKDPGPADT
ncbi:hypothetical protein [Streptomyces sp. cmx-4-9]|uniref:hypothetical protein n=1 Tax=Streptomyces sp. cmx-4-9 TaxID=2790941 RepID=UPI003980A64A